MPEKIVDFPQQPSPPITDEEKAKRVTAEVERLSRLPEVEWRFWVKRSSAERLGIPPEELRQLVEVRLREVAKTKRKAEAETRRQDRRIERQREKDQRREAKEAEKKSKDKGKAFTEIAQLPTDRSEAELERLAERIGEDAGAVSAEFEEYTESVIEPSSTPSKEWDVEAWPDQVTTEELLPAVVKKIDQHFAARPHEILAISLWAMMTWVHDIATYSTILAATSPEPDSGKTTMLGTVGFLVPRPIRTSETTGPNIFRLVDANKPTFILDEADTIFKRKPDVTSIFNDSWTIGSKISRQMKINGRWVTVYFSVFCPKAIGVLGANVPRAMTSRCITIKTLPKRPEDTQRFDHVDDETFAELRRKLLRWATDNAATLKDAKPSFPAGFNNRLQMNWRLLLSIAELAGGDWPQRTQEAAERVSRLTYKPSLGRQLLAALQRIFAGHTELTSERIVARLRANPADLWCEYNRGGAITQRQVAHLLEQYDIASVVLHPTRRSNFSRHGYRLAQFVDAFARYVPADPNIRTSQPRPKPRKKPKRKSPKKSQARKQRKKRRRAR